MKTCTVYCQSISPDEISEVEEVQTFRSKKRAQQHMRELEEDNPENRYWIEEDEETLDE